MSRRRSIRARLLAAIPLVAAVVAPTSVAAQQPAVAEVAPAELASRIEAELLREGLSLERLGYALSVSPSQTGDLYVVLRFIDDPAATRVRVVAAAAGDDVEVRVAELVVVVDGLVRQSASTTAAASEVDDTLTHRMRVASTLYDRRVAWDSAGFEWLLPLNAVSSFVGKGEDPVVPMSVAAGGSLAGLGASLLFAADDPLRQTVPAVSILTSVGAASLLTVARSDRRELEWVRASLGVGYLVSAVAAGVVGTLRPRCSSGQQKRRYDALAAADQEDRPVRLAELEACIERQRQAVPLAYLVSAPMLVSAGSAFYFTAQERNREDRLIGTLMATTGLLAAGVLQLSWGTDSYGSSYRELLGEGGLKLGVGFGPADGGMGVTLNGQF